MSHALCRWGILSTANIARKNWQAIRRSGNGRIVAVASRGVEKARRFIAECQHEQPFDAVPEAVGGYDELLQRADVDAVYIPLPTGLRKEWVLKAAAAGKHVMCEKPCASNLADLVEMTDACRKHNVQFMDGVMFMHSRRMPQLRAVLDDGQTVGEIRRITSQFTFRAPEEFLKDNIRMSSDLEPHGCLGDLGWYTIRFALWVMNFQLPRLVTGRLIAQQSRADSPDAVPIEFSGELLFDNDVTAGFYCSFRTEHQALAHVSGSRGFIELNDFVLPFFGNELAFRSENSVFDIEGCEFRMERHSQTHSVAEYSHSHETAQETRLFRTFSDIVLKGQLDPHWPDIALKTQQVMEACLASARDGGKAVTLR